MSQVKIMLYTQQEYLYRIRVIKKKKKLKSTSNPSELHVKNSLNLINLHEKFNIFGKDHDKTYYHNNICKDLNLPCWNNNIQANKYFIDKENTQLISSSSSSCPSTKTEFKTDYEDESSSISSSNSLNLTNTQNQHEGMAKSSSRDGKILYNFSNERSERILNKECKWHQKRRYAIKYI